VVYFFIAALVLSVATAGAAINFSLIARPMAEMVGGTSFVGSFRTADIAALVIIMVEISMGLFLMESLRITRLFPVISALSDKMRVRMIFITFTILLLMASVEAGLAYMREVLLQDELATSSLLRGDAVAAAINPHLWITTAAQMGMGFILPFALVFVAIPLETFVHSLRTVMGLIAIGVLRVLSLLLRVLGNGARHLGTLGQQVYDLMLFVPLWIETRMAVAAAEEAAEEAADGALTSKRRPGRRHNHEATCTHYVRPAGAVRLCAAFYATSHRRVPPGRYFWNLQPSGQQGGADHSVCAVAAAAGRLDRGRSDRHREFYREEHHRQDDLG
jgi:hypothetical protein